MIRILILIILDLLGFETTTNTPARLNQQQPQKQKIINPTLKRIIIFALLEIVFVIFFILFMPGTESGVYYNGGI